MLSAPLLITFTVSCLVSYFALITVGFVASSLPLVAGVGMTCIGSYDIN